MVYCYLAEDLLLSTRHSIYDTIEVRLAFGWLRFIALTLVEVVTLKRYISVIIAIGSLKIQNSNRSQIADGEHINQQSSQRFKTTT